jgi:SAM-dependent methyltransferase
MAIANREQAEHWNSPEQSGEWVTHQERYDRMLSPFTGVLLDAARLSPGETVLDVGCGCGATTLAAARAVAPGTATGVDLSIPMLARARQIAAEAGVANASFEEGDAQVSAFSTSFDAVISRLGVMFFEDPVAAFANLRAATGPGGRLAFVCWQPLLDNEWLVVPVTAMTAHISLPDLPDPQEPGMFALSEPDRVRQILGRSGWDQVAVASRHASILVGGGTVDDAVAFFTSRSISRRILESADADAQARAIRSVRDTFEHHSDGSGVYLDAAIWLVQARSPKPVR